MFFLGGEFSQYGNIKKTQWEKLPGVFFWGGRVGGVAKFFLWQKSPYFEEKSHMLSYLDN